VNLSALHEKSAIKQNERTRIPNSSWHRLRNRAQKSA